MALPPSGTLTWAQVAVELGMLSTATLASNDTLIFTLTGKSVGSTVVFPTDFYGKSLDTVPDAFTFRNVTAKQTVVQPSEVIIPTGFNAQAPISISGTGTPSYSINGAAFTNANGTIFPGDTLQLRVTTHSSSGSSVAPVVTIGGVSSTWTVTSSFFADTSPNTPGYGANRTNLQRSTYVYPVITSWTVSGLGSGVISTCVATNCSYRVNGGPWLTQNSGVINGDVIEFRVLTSSSYSTTVNANLLVGDKSDDVSFTTIAANDSTPAAFGWGTDVVDMPNQNYVSSIITIEEISTSVTASITSDSSFYGFRVMPVGGSWDSYSTANRTVNVGDQIQLTMRSGGLETTKTATLTVGGTSGSWEIFVSNV